MQDYKSKELITIGTFYWFVILFSRLTLQQIYGHWWEVFYADTMASKGLLSTNCSCRIVALNLKKKKKKFQW